MRFELLLEVVLLFLFAEAIYQLAISLVGLGPVRAVRPRSPRKRFAFFVPAHDEETVIAANVRSLLELDYPRHLYDVHVIADHCADATATEAEAAGAIVLARDRGPRDGKPGALNWAWRRLGRRLERYDAVVIVDADNLVAPDFLAVMNARLLAGERLVQANLDVKNPEGSWVTRVIALAYWSTSRIHQFARHRLGWCAALGGTGICIDRALLHALGWNAHSLTEDLDFQIRALQRGVRTTWAHETRIFDEKPTTLRASLRQRLRWMRGHMGVALRQLPRLVAAGVRSRSWACLDSALYLLQPFKLAVGFVALSVWILWAAAGEPRFHVADVAIGLFGALYLLHLSQYLFWGVGILALVRERVPARFYLWYLPAFLFGMTWVAVVFAAMAKPRGSWTPTRHTARMEIGERLAYARGGGGIGK